MNLHGCILIPKALFGVKIKFYKKHLDMLFTETSGLSKDVLGLIGM